MRVGQLRSLAAALLLAFTLPISAGAAAAASEAAASSGNPSAASAVGSFALVRGPDGVLRTTAVDGIGTDRNGVAGEVLAVVPDVVVTGAVAVEDPLRSVQSHLDATTFEAAWPRHDGRGVTVAVVDSGVLATHEDLSGGQVTIGECYLEGGGATSPCTPAEVALPLHPHATAVASLIAAGTANGVGVAGAAPGARVRSIRVLGPDNSGRLQDVTDGILAAGRSGAEIINLSVQVDTRLFDEVTFDAVRDAFQLVVDEVMSLGSVVVAAAGNLGADGNPRVLPAAVEGVIAVGSLASDGVLAATSSTGDYVDVVAPGVGLRAASSASSSSYADNTGTSFAAPLVAAQAAMLAGAFPAAGPGEIEAWITATATDQGVPGRDDLFGHGKIDPAAALDAAGVAAPPPLVVSAVQDGASTEVTWTGGSAMATTYEVAIDDDPATTVRAPSTGRVFETADGTHVVEVAARVHYVLAAMAEPAQVPPSPSLTVELVGTDASLSWSPQGTMELIGFEVWRDGVLVVTLDADARSHVDPALTPGAAVVYRVVALGPTGASRSAAVTVGVPLPPVAPETFVGTRVGGEVDLQWSEPSGTVTSLEVLRNDEIIDVLSPDARAYRDTSPPLGTPNRYVLNVIGPLGGAATPEVTVIAAIPPGTPTLSVTQTAPAVTVSWESGGGTTIAWRVLRQGVVIAELPPEAREYLDVDAPPESLVDYGVVAVGPYELAPSALISFYVAAPPVAPTAFTAQRQGAAIALAWGDPAGTVDTLRVRRDGTVITELAPGERAFVDAGPPLGVVLEYVIEAVGPLGTDRTDVVESLAATPPIAPVVAVAQIDDDVEITWDGAGGTLTGIRIERNGATVENDLPPGRTRWVDRDAPEGELLEYVVVAVGPYEAQASEPRSIVVAFPIEVTAFAARQVGADVELSWSVEGTVSDVTVVRDGVVIATLGPGTDTYLDRTAPPHEVSSYRIVVSGPLGERPSEDVSLRVVFDPVAPTVVTAIRLGPTVALEWNAPDGTVDVLRIRRNGAIVTELAPDARSFTDATPPLGVDLRYRIEAVGPRGTDRSDVVDSLAATPPAPPVVVLSQSGVDVVVTWDDAGGTLTGFRIERNGETVARLGPNESRWVDGEATDGIELIYVVVAVGHYDEEAASEARSILVARPITVAAFEARQVGEVVELSWVVTGTRSSIEVTRDGVTIAALGPDEKQFVDDTAPAHIVSDYRIVVTGPRSQVFSQVIPVRLEFPLEAPETVTATWTEGAVQLIWSEPSGTIDLIEVLRDGVVIATYADPTVRIHVDENPPTGVTLRYQIRVVGPFPSKVSQAVEALAPEPPAAPEEIGARQIGAVIELSWTEPGGTVTGLVVRRDGVDLATLEPTAKSFVDRSAPPHVVSTYRLVVRGPLGEAETEAVPIRLSFPPTAPTTFTATSMDGTAVLTWSAPGGTVDDIVVRRIGGGIVSVGPAARRYVDTAVSLGETVQYELVVKGPNSEARSGVVTVTVLRPAPPPTNVRLSTGPGRLELTWDDPALGAGAVVSGYDVEIRSAGGTLRRVTTAVRSALISGLPRGADVEYSVAVVTSGGPGDPATGSARIPRTGYWMLGVDGAVHAFGEAAVRTSADVLAPAQALLEPGDRAISLDVTATGRGAVVLYRSGRVVALGDAVDHGGVVGAGLDAGEKPASISLIPGGDGYWVFTDRGRVLARGTAPFLEDLFSITGAGGVPIGRLLNGPIIASVGTPTGAGYYMVASDGGVFAFGDAEFRGSMGGIALNRPVVGLAPTPDNRGYWLVAADGGVFAFDAPFLGSLPGVLGVTQELNAPVSGLVPSGSGYLMSAADGGVFAFGTDVDFEGSLGGSSVATIVDIAALR